MNFSTCCSGLGSSSGQQHRFLRQSASFRSICLLFLTASFTNQESIAYLTSLSKTYDKYTEHSGSKVIESKAYGYIPFAKKFLGICNLHATKSLV